MILDTTLCGVGKDKLRELTDREDCPFVLWVGSKRLIRRKKLDEYLLALSAHGQRWQNELVVERKRIVVLTTFIDIVRAGNAVDYVEPVL